MIRILFVAVLCLCSAHAVPCPFASRETLLTEPPPRRNEGLGAGGTAAEKLNCTWKKITEDEISHGFMNPLKTAFYAHNLTYLRLMGSTQAEEREVGHEKITHGIGGHARAHFEWSNHSYSGLFAKAEHCLIRIANAAEPSKSMLNPTSYNPNMAVKCFTDGAAAAANLQTLWTIDGYDKLPADDDGNPTNADSCSYFDVPLSNHCGNRANLSLPLKEAFIKNFEKVDPPSMPLSENALLLGVSQMAKVTQDGQAVEDGSVNFPYALVFNPVQGLEKVPCDWDDVTSQLHKLNSIGWVGSALYDVYTVHDPWTTRPNGQPELKKIGQLVLDSPFVKSAYGDTRLFFRHTFQSWELATLGKTSGGAARAASWAKYDKEHFMDEGAAWYMPHIPPTPPVAPPCHEILPQDLVPACQNGDGAESCEAMEYGAKPGSCTAAGFSVCCVEAYPGATPFWYRGGSYCPTESRSCNPNPASPPCHRMFDAGADCQNGDDAKSCAAMDGAKPGTCTAAGFPVCCVAPWVDASPYWFPGEHHCGSAGSTDKRC